MTCLDARKKIYDYLNNKLTDVELKDFIDHVNGCDECMDELRITHMVYRGAAELDSDADTNLNIDEVRARYSPQIASRLEGSFQLLPFVGNDIRVLKNK